MTDYTDKFNTQLSAADEAAFQKWLTAAGRAGDLRDYDMRGAWLENRGKQAANGHFTDRYKKPNHPTFSTESQYSGGENGTGGQWLEQRDGKWRFRASDANLKNMTPQELQEYFNRVEPDAILEIPTASILYR